MVKKKGKAKNTDKGEHSGSSGSQPPGAQPQQQGQQQQQAWSRGPPQGAPSQKQQAWSRGPPQGAPPQQQQGQPEQQQAWSRGPPQGAPPQKQQAWSRGPPQGAPPQKQQAWSRGPPQGAPPQQQQGQPEQQQAWSRGPPQGAPPQQQQGQPEQQQAWSRGPPQGAPPQQQQAWPRGPPQGAPPQQQQGQPEQQQAWSRGPPQGAPPQQQQAWPRGRPQSAPQQQQGQPEQQQAWPRGPPQGAPPQQQQGQPEQQQAWSRGPPQGAPPQQQQGQPEQQQAWPRGAPPQQQQGQPEQQQAWSRGPPQGAPPQQQQAWPRGRPQSAPQQQQGQPEQQQAWSRGPPQGAPPQQQQAWPRGPPQSAPPQQQEQKQVPQKSGGKGTKKSEELVGSYEFAERITAPKKSGVPIKVATNFFALIISDPTIVVHHYDVEIEPDKPKYLIRKVWKKYASLVFPERLTAFDGKNAYSKGPLTEAVSSVTTVTVYNEESQREKEFKVSLKEVRTISFSCFENYRERMLKDRSLKIIPEAEIAALDIIIGNWASDNFVRVGRSFFPSSSTSPETKDLSNKLSLQVGYFQSAVLGYTPYLNFDITHKGFYKPSPMLKVFECFQHQRTKQLDANDMNHFIKGVKVEYRLPNDPSTYRVYRVNKLVGNADSQTFTKEDGSTMTVAEYFAVEKKCKLKYPELPLLWVGSTQKSIYLPMEYCKIAPDQVYKGQMNSFEKREMVRSATSNARQRQKDVYDLFDRTDINSQPLMREFGLSVASDMEVVPARVLSAPELKGSRNIRVREGVWRTQGFLEPVSLDRWCIVTLDKQLRRENLSNLQKMIKEKGRASNMRIADPARDFVEGDPSIAGLKKMFSQLKDMQLVFVIIPDVPKGVYSKVKSICETQESILTQCIKSSTACQDMRKLPTTVENILLKVNTKMGGKNHCLDRNSLPQCLEGNVMVVGADVTHPSPGMKMPSVAAITVSCDVSAFQYGMTARVQPKGEMIQDLQEMIDIHLKKFYKLRGKYPEKIIFFRDGVSEGEMEKVLKGELEAVKRACQPYCKPKITFVTVQKRHHTRFFPVSEADAQGKNFNVPVGTCVDSDIVHPRELDFYLVSHASLLGTARPTRYRLLHDDNKLTDDELERAAFYLCHLFARCNRSVSYPSPTYNAHLAAARIRAYFEGLNLGGDLSVSDIQKKIPDRISSISPMFFV